MSCPNTNMSFQRSLLCQQKFKKVTVEGKLCHL